MEDDKIIKEYDDKRNMIHYKNSSGFEWWREYDENGNKIHHKDSTGFEYWDEYDTNGNKIHHKPSDGHEWWREYDENGNKIYYKDSTGFEGSCEYDERGNLIHYKNSSGFEWWREYDENNQLYHIYGAFKSYSYDKNITKKRLSSMTDTLGCTYDVTKDHHINNKIFIKGLHADMTGYDGFQFEIGKEYKIDSDKIRLCTDKVFHFGRTLLQVLRFYNIPTDRFFEIEVLGELIDGIDKCASNHIRIVREIIL